MIELWQLVSSRVIVWPIVNFLEISGSHLSSDNVVTIGTRDVVPKRGMFWSSIILIVLMISCFFFCFFWILFFCFLVLFFFWFFFFFVFGFVFFFGF